MIAAEPARRAAPQAPAAPAPRRIYAVPRLTMHGTVAELPAAKTGLRPLAPGYLTEG